MSRILACLVICAWAGLAQAQEFSALARLDAEKSSLQSGWRGAVTLEMSLSQGVPWRIFRLDEPRRLVIDFREVDWGQTRPEDFGTAEGVAAVRFGGYRPGWSRMVLDLSAPLVVETAEMAVAEGTGPATLTISLVAATPEAFTQGAGAPHDPRWDLPEPATTNAEKSDKPVWAPTIVVIDPGHGGIDPGAERDGIQEKDLMLSFARELRDTLRRTGGFDVYLTRDADEFVSLERRVAIAHQLHADVFISLHADSLSEGHAHGAAVYTLADEATDAASALLAERHDRADILSGVDLSGADDEVTDVLLDLARLETEPRTDALAGLMVNAMRAATGALNKKPKREGAFSVLKAADVPSVLIELGFMSSERDLNNLRDPGWRASMASGIRDGLQAWVIEDKAAKALVRQ
ncbi:MAG: N-acetylmuramoyl-L-alanine amidase [Shimia sp.]|uniref:N-acetylmuramoyl-L-alanine amidase n=1 Tax=Shimia sp. TaxID=1954381 RepID=UPI0040598AB0